MPVLTSKVTTKGQATIPEELRRELSIKPGQRLVWEIGGGKLIALLARDLLDLSGSLKSEVPFPGEVEEKKALRVFRVKHYAKNHGKS